MSCAATQSISARQTSELVDRHLMTGQFGLHEIARQLGLHERTLQRRLAEQNLYFEEIVDQVRRERASEYLQFSAIPLIQVATFLGYSNQTALTRACRRWFGESPQDHRRGNPGRHGRTNLREPPRKTLTSTGC